MIHLNSFTMRVLMIGPAAIVLGAISQPSVADVKLPAIFSDHMVLQQGRENAIWGWAEPGEKIEVSVNGQSHNAVADEDGVWRLNLDELPVGRPYEIKVQGNNEVTISDVLVGEVWVCSGQSNMEWAVQDSDDADLERLAADYPQIRMVTVPKVASQEPLKDFQGSWSECTPETVGSFSAVGYFFGRLLHKTLDVPIGLIDNAWGGSACEAWVRRDVLENDDRFEQLMARWKDIESNYDYEQELDKFRKAVKQWEDNGRQGNRPMQPWNLLQGNSRPANLYNGQLAPIVGYGIRGVIWYQGETNAGRAYQYRDLFPLMIQNWRDDWAIGDFSFYWVQLADFLAESEQPGDSDWAELREAQTMTMDKLPNTGQAVIIDRGEADDIHPRDKRTVAMRLARWALANNYGKDLAFRSPQFKSIDINGSKAIVTFDVGDRPDTALDTFDIGEVRGFAIAGDDRKFVWAHAAIVGRDKVEVWSDEVPEPAAVRYAWANNPVCNLRNRAGLPATPFRSDDWPGVTADRQ
jgi:sialate O-acetylesterase